MIYIYVDVEDILLASFGKRLLTWFDNKYSIIGEPKVAGGKGNIDKKIAKLNLSAQHGKVHLVLRDLDAFSPGYTTGGCASEQISRLLGSGEHHPNLLLRFAAAEAESWLMADTQALCDYLRITDSLLGRLSDTDFISEPKQHLLKCVRRDSSRRMREALLREKGKKLKPGPEYNSVLTNFVLGVWDLQRAAKRSTSLRRALRCLDNFEPVSR